jgi:hypothetical protein
MGGLKKWVRRLKNILLLLDYALTKIETIIPTNTTRDKIASCLNLGFIFEPGL